MDRKYKALCLIFALLITLFFLSGLFLSFEHDCTHESCQVCSFMTSIKKMLATLCLVLTALYGVVALFPRQSIPVRSLVTWRHAVTSVTLKVKLSD